MSHPTETADVELCRAADLVKVIAELTMEGSGAGEGTVEQLQAALIRLIDERIEQSIAQHKPMAGDTNLPRVSDAFPANKGCRTCLGTGTVCEAHPDKAWGAMVSDDSNPQAGACYCGAAGEPCPNCRANANA
jgi:hypothetical protein